jgi:hypothetical protein
MMKEVIEAFIESGGRNRISRFSFYVPVADGKAPSANQSSHGGRE